MATEYESSLISQYGEGMQSFIDAERLKGKSGLLKGSNVDSQDVSGITSAFLRANSTAGNEVYSASNIATPVSPPNLSDPFGLYDYYFSSPEMKAAQEASSTAYEDILSAQAAAREEQTALGQNLQSMTRIRGAQAQARELSANELAALSDIYNVSVANLDTLTGQAQAKYGIASSERDKIQSLITQTGGKAGISYTDSFESATKKAQDYIDKQAEGDYKKSLQDEARSLGLSTKTSKGGTLDIKGLEKALEKYYKETGESERAIKARMDELDMRSKELSIASAEMSLAGGGGKAPRTSEYTDYEVRAMAAQAVKEAEAKGLYGYYLWEDVTKAMRDENVDILTGSPLDKYMKSLFGMSSDEELL